jgi:broad specificity phosphatase PhoE
MSRRLILVRHALVDIPYQGRLVGSTDAPLAPEGLAQARALAGRILRWKPDACVCSPMQRCRQTAAMLPSQLPLEVDPDLREIDFGQWENRVFAEAAAEQPALVERWAAFDLDFAFPGGESIGQFLNRVHAAADRLARAAADTILVVSHSGVVRALLCRFLGIESRKYVAFSVPYTALAVIDLFPKPLSPQGRGENPHDSTRGVLVALEPPVGQAFQPDVRLESLTNVKEVDGG